MLHQDTLAWIDDLILTRDIVTPGERTEFFQRVRRGEFVPLRRGAYVSAERWSVLNPDDRYRLRIRAVVAFADRDLVVSHISAAALWELPWIDRWPRAVHILSSVSAGGRSSKFITRHLPGHVGATARIDGIAVTSLARTVVDVATLCSFEQGVVVADSALRLGMSKPDLVAALGKVAFNHGNAKAERVANFADGDAASVGESISRVNIHLAHLTAPLLQSALYGASGARYFVDFWWPDFNVIGEFDGIAKYQDPQFLAGRTPQQALREEKVREDDLRAAGHGMSRWMWDTAIEMPALRAQLMSAGVR